MDRRKVTEVMILLWTLPLPALKRNSWRNIVIALVDPIRIGQFSTSAVAFHEKAGLDRQRPFLNAALNPAQGQFAGASRPANRASIHVIWSLAESPITRPGSTSGYLSH
jgi:hypothetical protein